MVVEVVDPQLDKKMDDTDVDWMCWMRWMC